MAELPPIHLSPLSTHASGATPWDFSPAWFVLLALALPALLWAVLACKRVLDEDPNRLRRAGRRELDRLLSRLRGTGGPPRPADLAAWCQAAARTWDVRAAAPTGAEVARSLQAQGGDAATLAQWQELWSHTETSLYAADGAASTDWIGEATSAADKVRIPPRQQWLPLRLRHWLPSLAGLCLFACLVASGSPLRAAEAGLPSLDAKAAAALGAAQDAAGEALRADWNNWTAHYDIAAQQMVQGNVDYAVAHLTAAFLQHPASTIVQDNLRWSLQQAGVMDPTLRRLLYGAWFQRYPALLSPASWQRLGLAAALVIAAGLCALVLSLYLAPRRRELQRIGRWAVAGGLVPLAVAVLAWNAWGDLHRPSAAMLVAGISLCPVPTELVKEQETVPVNAGTVAVQQSVFLGWKQVRVVDVPNVGTGWLRAGFAMPLYAN